MDKLRVLVADDSRSMTVACKRILETQEHIEVVGMAADGEEAVRQAEDLKPHVAVLDVRMPKMTGIEAAQQITANRPGTGIVIMSNYDDAEYIVGLLRDGTEGKAYLLKTSIDDIDELIKAVEAVAVGRTLLDHEIVRRLVMVNVSSPGLLSYTLKKEMETVVSLMAVAQADVAVSEDLVAVRPLFRLPRRCVPEADAGADGP